MPTPRTSSPWATGVPADWQDRMCAASAQITADRTCPACGTVNTTAGLIDRVRTSRPSLTQRFALAWAAFAPRRFRTSQ